jgi:hypothetical protein
MADSTATDRKLLPPYVPAKTCITFLDHLPGIGGMPSHIDKAVMSNLSGGMQSWLKASLRYMKLINAEDEPTVMLAKLAGTQGDDRKPLLRELFNSTYSFLAGKIDLQNTTPQKLRSAIVELGAQGETVEKIMSFLIGLGKEAGVTLSPYLTKRTIGPRRPRQKTAKKEGVPVAAGDTDDEEDDDAAPAMTKTVSLPNAAGRVTLIGNFNPLDLVGEERTLVYALVDKMNEFAAKQKEEDDA